MSTKNKTMLTWEAEFDGDDHHYRAVLAGGDNCTPCYYLTDMGNERYTVTFIDGTDNDDLILINGDKEPVSLAKAKAAAEEHAHSQREGGAR
jgi:hypothetical protein